MATVAPARIATPLGRRNLRVWKWDGINAGDTITPLIVGGYTDITVFFLKGGAFGGSMALTGSPDPADGAPYVTLDDAEGTAISGITSDDRRTVLDHPYLLKPSAGAGVADVDVWAVLGSTK